MRNLELIGAGSHADFKSLGEYAYLVIRRNIVRGVLPPASRLRPDELAASLDVSRMPVREALQRLADEGLVHNRAHGRGAIVESPDIERVIEYSQVRWALERLSAGLAATRASKACVGELRALVQKGRVAAEKDDWEQDSELGSRFHLTVARAAGNGHLLDQVRKHEDFLGWAASSMSRVLRTSRWDFHAAIAEAIAAGDATAAMAEMDRHAEASCEPMLRGARLSP